MKLSKVFLSFLLMIFLSSCENQNQQSVPPEDNGSQTKSETEPEPVVPPELLSKKVNDPPPELPMPDLPKPEEKVKEIAAKPIKAATAPQMPSFSKELLQAVQNWKRVPPSVFPLGSVNVQSPVTFKVLSTQGQVIATSSLPQGEEVVALGLRGNTLTISPSLNSKLRATIDIKETDFKQGVAYLFEIRKRQREYFEKERLRKLELAKSSAKGEKLKPVAEESTTSLFEDLPGPGDYGHGKFCICSDCREKRLADTGSMK
ncbi:MAG: hypothetical protein CBC00_03085 [Verrucomicrobia bacterium TMED40]|nr:MAG: hypothetical protein CBC00_03085 [Verrucomicrobia bacterium TMED40]|tara:strand:- start:250 stop:1029 length:780 start_codon:yes stop_codon:yes gene_type:complete